MRLMAEAALAGPAIEPGETTDEAAVQKLTYDDIRSILGY